MKFTQPHSSFQVFTHRYTNNNNNSRWAISMKEPVPLSRAGVGVELGAIIQNKPMLNKLLLG